jgi:hypothetical protein
MPDKHAFFSGHRRKRRFLATGAPAAAMPPTIAAARRPYQHKASAVGVPLNGHQAAPGRESGATLPPPASSCMNTSPESLLTIADKLAA